MEILERVRTKENAGDEVEDSPPVSGQPLPSAISTLGGDFTQGASTVTKGIDRDVDSLQHG